MGYSFHKRGAERFYIRLADASTVRAAASIEGLMHLMPATEVDGGSIPLEHRARLAAIFREQSDLLKALADYFDDADDLRWGH